MQTAAAFAAAVTGKAIIGTTAGDVTAGHHHRRGGKCELTHQQGMDDLDHGHQQRLCMWRNLIIVFFTVNFFAATADNRQPTHSSAATLLRHGNTLPAGIGVHPARATHLHQST